MLVTGIVTLWLLLIIIAFTTPVCGGVVEGSRKGVLGILIGLIVGLGVGCSFARGFSRIGSYAARQVHLRGKAQSTWTEQLPFVCLYFAVSVAGLVGGLLAEKITRFIVRHVLA